MPLGKSPQSTDTLPISPLGIVRLNWLWRCCWGNSRIEGQHHSHVFVLHVVAVQHKRALKGPEGHQHLHLATPIQNQQVAFEAVFRSWWATILADHLVGFQMDMHGMPPSPTAVAADPAFDGA